MVIDVRKLNAQKRYTGKLEFDYEADETLIGIPFVTFEAPVKIVADYELFEDDALELKGKIFFRLHGKCSRCLGETSQSFEGELNALFEPFVGGDDYSYSGGKIDLTDALNDAIMASMPMTLSCKEECEGIKF